MTNLISEISKVENLDSLADFLNISGVFIALLIFLLMVSRYSLMESLNVNVVTKKALVWLFFGMVLYHFGANQKSEGNANVNTDLAFIFAFTPVFIFSLIKFANKHNMFPKIINSDKLWLIYPFVYFLSGFFMNKLLSGINLENIGYVVLNIASLAFMTGFIEMKLTLIDNYCTFVFKEQSETDGNDKNSIEGSLLWLSDGYFFIVTDKGTIAYSADSILYYKQIDKTKS